MNDAGHQDWSLVLRIWQDHLTNTASRNSISCTCNHDDDDDDFSSSSSSSSTSPTEGMRSFSSSQHPLTPPSDSSIILAAAESCLHLHNLHHLLHILRTARRIWKNMAGKMVCSNNITCQLICIINFMAPTGAYPGAGE
jgi:hypothetical protein